MRASPNTKYRIASISKCFTSLLAGRLVDRGQLDLDKDIRTYLPDFTPVITADKQSAVLTTRQLLSHTSGLRHYRKVNESDSEGVSDIPLLL